MRDYFMSLVVAAIIGTILSGLVGGTFEKYIKYIISLICIMIILMPIKEFLGLNYNLDDFSMDESIPEISGSDSFIINISKGRIEQAVISALEKKFDFTPAKVEVHINSSEKGIEVEGIDVYITMVDAYRGNEMRNYLETTFGVDIKLIIEEK